MSSGAPTTPHVLEPAPSPPEAARAGGTAPWSAGLFCALLLVYSVVGDPVGGNDCTSNVALAAQVVDSGKLTFTPEASPALFSWQVETERGPMRGPVRQWSQLIEGKTAEALRREGRLTLDGPMYYLVPSMRPGEYVSAFGVGVALAAAPVFAAARLFAGGPLGERTALAWHAGKAAASLFVALSAVFVFLAALTFVDRPRALAVALVYGLGTCAFSISSQSLWQHGPSSCFLAAAAYFFLAGPEVRWRSAALGACLGAAVMVRPDALVPAFVLGAATLVSGRRAAMRLAAGALPFAVGQALLAWTLLGSPFASGQAQAGAAIALAKLGSADLFPTPLWVGLPGVLVSPARGLFVYSPILLLSVLGAVAAWRGDARYRPLRAFTLSIGVTWVLAAAHFDWWGGWSFGYRHLVDTTPFLALLLVPALEGVLSSPAPRWLAIAFTAWSVFIQGLAVTAVDLEGWNIRRAWLVKPPSVDEPVIEYEEAAAASAALRWGPESVVEVKMDIGRPEFRFRLWSLSDNPIGYSLAHFTEARAARAAQVRTFLGAP